MKNKKLLTVLKALGAFALLLAVCLSSALIFHSYYYELIYVSGTSMSPTLNGVDDDASGSLVDFGIVDAHKSALDHIKRFDIVSTYYPDATDYDAQGNLYKNAKKKIKRVVALPGETFKVEKGKIYVLNGSEFELQPATFKTIPSQEDDYTGKDTIAPPWKISANSPPKPWSASSRPSTM